MALGICQGTVVVVVIVAPDISRWQDARDCTPQLSLRLQLICAQEPHQSIVILIFNFCPRDRVSATHPSRLELQIFAYRYKFNRTDSQVGKNRWQFKISIHSFIQSINHKCVRSSHNVKPVTHTRSMNISCRQPLFPLGQCLIVLFQINLLLGL